MISFETYLDDVLDLHVALLSKEQIAEARIAYESATGRQVTKKHPDMARKAGELKTRCERLVNGQRKAIERRRITDQAALAAARFAVAEGERLLTKRSTKAEFIAHSEMNSDASRLMNAAR